MSTTGQELCLALPLSSKQPFQAGIAPILFTRPLRHPDSKPLKSTQLISGKARFWIQIYLIQNPQNSLSTAQCRMEKTWQTKMHNLCLHSVSAGEGRVQNKSAPVWAPGGRHDEEGPPRYTGLKLFLFSVAKGGTADLLSVFSEKTGNYCHRLERWP